MRFAVCLCGINVKTLVFPFLKNILYIKISEMDPKFFKK